MPVHAEINAESSPSHLVIGVIIELTNKTNGSVHKGKVRMVGLSLQCSYRNHVIVFLQLSIVDLAGSERASKSGTTEQLKVSTGEGGRCTV